MPKIPPRALKINPVNEKRDSPQIKGMRPPIVENIPTFIQIIVLVFINMF